MKFRLVCLVITIFVISAIIPLQAYAQCGDPVPTEPGPTASTGDVELTFWHTMDDNEAINLQTIIDTFTEETNISVVVKRIDPSTAYEQFVQSFDEVNATPDVFRVETQWTTKLADDNLLLALCSTYNSTEWADFMPELLMTGMYAGKKFGVPQTAEIYGLFYNKQQLSNKSINPQFSNLDAFKTAIATLGSDYQNGNYGFVLSSMMETYLPFMWGKGGNFFTGKIKADNLAINTDGSVAGLEYVNSLISMPETPTAGMQFNHEIAILGLQYGNISMTLDNSASIESYLAGPMFNKTAYVEVFGTSAPSWVGPDNLGIAAIPGDNNDSIGTLLGGYNLVASKITKYPAEAMQFVKYLTSVETNVLLGFKNNFLPARTTALGNYLISQLRSFKTQINDSKSYPAVPYWNDLEKILDHNLNSYFKNEQTSQQALENVSVNWIKVMQDFKPQYDDPNVLKRTIPGFEIFMVALGLGIVSRKLRIKR